MFVALHTMCFEFNLEAFPIETELWPFGITIQL